MAQSIGIIGKCEDPLVTKEIEIFLKQLPGFRLIYFTHDETHRLYIVNGDRLKRLTSSLNGGDADEQQ